MSYQLKVIKDYPMGFWPLDESSGSTAYDISGCGNNGIYYDGISTGIIPLVSGGISGSLITDTKYIELPLTKDYYGSTVSGGFADYNSSENDFSLEIWFYPKLSTGSLTPIFADTTEETGIYYEAGNIVFKLEGTQIDYTIPHIKQSHHIVAMYSKNEMSLWVDGKFASNKSLVDFKFTAESITLKLGPTSDSSDSFIVDAPAVYRYSLNSEKILSHYNYSDITSPYQIATPESGTIFEIFDDGISSQFSFAYPANRPWEYFLTEDLNYNIEDKYLEIKKKATGGSKSVVMTDAIAIPAGFNLDSSKIEWNGDNGVSIRTSIDESTWVDCTNGMAIPQFKLDTGEFSSERILYIEISITSSDCSRFNPRLYSLIIRFYKDQILYSPNSADYISPIESGSIKEITMGRTNMPILSRHSLNGLRSASGSGFRVNTQDSLKTIELFVTLSSLAENSLIYMASGTGLAESEYSWSTGGSITKTNISAIYVNGIDKTSQTSVSSVFAVDEIFHVIIVLTSAGSMPIFNLGGPSALYQYIACYPLDINQANALNHYNMHIGRASAVANDSSMTMTENSVNFYNNDWVVLQNR